MKLKLIIPLAVFLYIMACKENNAKVVKTQEVAFKKEGELQILQKETDAVLLKLNIEIADNDYETQTGLMYRSGMNLNEGMLFVFDSDAMHSFYMKNTEFALDLLFIKSDMTIASISENAQPLNENSISSKVPIRYVLEVNAGVVAEKGIEIGDQIDYKKL